MQPGDTIAIVGAGPVGLAALMTARLNANNARRKTRRNQSNDAEMKTNSEPGRGPIYS